MAEEDEDRKDDGAVATAEPPKKENPWQGMLDGIASRASSVNDDMNKLHDQLAAIFKEMDRSVIEPFMPGTDHHKLMTERTADLAKDDKLVASVQRVMAALLYNHHVLTSDERKALFAFEESDPVKFKQMTEEYISVLTLWGLDELLHDKFFQFAGLPAMLTNMPMVVSPSVKKSFITAMAEGGAKLRGRLKRASKLARGEEVKDDETIWDTKLLTETLVEEEVSKRRERRKWIAASNKHKQEMRRVGLHRIELRDNFIYWDQVKKDAEAHPHRHGKLLAFIKETEALWEAEKDKKSSPYMGKIVNIFKRGDSGQIVSVNRVKTDCGEFAYATLLTPERASGRRLKLVLATHSAANQFTAKEEITAMRKLRRMITKEQFAEYIVSGEFYEESKRSNVTYLFRKLKPTIAMSFVPPEQVEGEDGKKPNTPPGMKAKNYRFLAGLCLHPGMFYNGTFVGALCPTDDVIAHLLKMRAEEHKFWAKANHHYLGEAELGI